MIYQWLAPRLGARAALIVTGVWYGTLLLLILLFAAEPIGDFRYDDI
jgi:hypothetical protein